MYDKGFYLFVNPAKMNLAPILPVWKYLLPFIFNSVALDEILRKQKSLILLFVIAICWPTFRQNAKITYRNPEITALLKQSAKYVQ